ncbi:MAG TPA: hypothetical protein IAC35_07295 [Candidatus Cryptobacteroides merdipullorum]|uniref:Uncharacterized protein n=1 Tax=Candidatus Cryptobacteroides merdipullorum TaxID=2840771 RepID=A0A9D1GPR3_9BACT|nr:hypothetical protein [Candidatus Cryptobacteroides merdipullorum]
MLCTAFGFRKRKAAAEGREILERRLRNWKLEFPDELLTEFMKSARFNSEMSMMAAIAAEELDVNDIKEFLLQKQAEKEEHAAQKQDSAQTADSPEAKKISDTLLSCALATLGLIRHEGIETQTERGFFVLTRSYSVLYRIGAGIELQRLGYKAVPIQIRK